MKCVNDTTIEVLREIGKNHNLKQSEQYAVDLAVDLLDRLQTLEVRTLVSKARCYGGSEEDTGMLIGFMAKEIAINLMKSRCYLFQQRDFQCRDAVEHTMRLTVLPPSRLTKVIEERTPTNER